MTRITINADLCKGCGLCFRACPRDLIAPSKTKFNVKGYHPAEITDMEKCIGCAACARSCPDIVIKVEKE